jgi:pantoate--beta-alanine ligase
MQQASTVAEIRQSVKQWRAQGHSIAFVPTMGNLHDGHLKLVEVAKTRAERVIVSIFVNPTQFGPNEDYSAYPRTEAEDCRKLQGVGADLVFLPEVSEVYGNNPKTNIHVKDLTALHCGTSRPVHFDGVATVVCKLFNIVQPDKAVFGLKDYQQCAVVRKMVEDLNLPVKIIPVATVREASGLAMSSRNGYLSPEQLKTAPVLYQALLGAKSAVLAQTATFSAIEQSALQQLQSAGFVPDYFSICNADTLLPAHPGESAFVILAAAKLGKTRLIDNIAFNSIEQ